LNSYYSKLLHRAKSAELVIPEGLNQRQFIDWMNDEHPDLCVDSDMKHRIRVADVLEERKSKMKNLTNESPGESPKFELEVYVKMRISLKDLKEIHRTLTKEANPENKPLRDTIKECLERI
jgi:hypothetical protein